MTDKIKISLYKPTEQINRKPISQPTTSSSNDKLKVTLTKPKYNYSDYENLSISDDNFYDKYKIKYGVDDEVVNLYKARYDVNDTLKNSEYAKFSKFQKNLAAKYIDIPKMNILSYGGDFQEYDNLINNILENGNDNGQYNAKIKELRNKLYSNSKYTRQDGLALSNKVAAEYDTFLNSLLDYSKASGIDRVSKSLENIMLSLAGSPIYAAETLGQGVKNLTQGTNDTVSEQSLGSTLLKQAQKSQSQATAGLTDTEAFLWNTGTSIANNLLNYATFGSFAPINMGIQAGSQAALNATERGGTYGQALGSGVAQGTAEGFFEKISLGNLKSLKNMTSYSVKSFAKNLVKQSAIEASEEMATEATNIVSDMLIMKDKAEMTKYFNQYLENNPDSSKKTALWATVGEALKQVGEAGASGAISGGVLGGGSQVMGIATQQGRTANQNFAIREQSQKALEELNNKGKVSDKTLKSLNEAVNLTDKQKQSNITAPSEKDLNSLIGFTIQNNEFTSNAKETEAIRKSIESGVNNIENVKAMYDFAKSKDVKINTYYDTDNMINGFYDNNTINVNLASSEGAYYTAVHEYGHYLEDNAPTMLKNYVNQVNALIKTNERFKAISDSVRELYKNNPKTANLKPQAINNEIAFKITKELIDNPTQFNDIVTKNRTAGQKMLSWLKSFYNRIKGTSLKSEQKAVQDAVRALEKALSSKVKADVAKNATTQYSLAETKAVKNTKKEYPMTGQEINQTVRKAVGRQYEYNRISNRIVDSAKTLRDYKKGDYINAGFLADARLEQYAKILSKLQIRGNLLKKPQSLREAIVKLDKFYRPEILDNESTDAYFYMPQIRDDIDKIIDRYNKLESGKNKSYKLTFAELQAIDRITSHIKHLYTNYDTVLFKGKTQKASNIANKAITQLNNVQKLTRLEATPAIKALLHPSDYFAMSENYQDGILTDIYNELQDGTQESVKYQREAIEQFKTFFDKNPKYENTLRQDMDNGLTKGQALALYMTYQRQQGKEHLEANGKIEVANDVQAKKGNYAEANKQSKFMKFDEKLLPKLTKADEQYIKLVQKYFNWSGKKVSEVEKAKYGFANPKEDNYFPIAVSGTDIFTILGESRKSGYQLSRPTFTYTLTSVGKGKALYIGNILDIISNQINQASAFVGYSVKVSDIAKIYNAKVDNINLQEKLKGINKDFNSYLDAYLKDIQGIKRSMDTAERVIGKMRAWFGRTALGLNPKVWFNQLTSIPMAKSVGLNFSSQAKGAKALLTLLSKPKQFMQEYNDLVELVPEIWKRYEGNIAIKEALGLQAYSKFDKVMDFTTKPIQTFDKMAIMSLWQACKAQNQNTDSAVEMFKNVLRKTQPNYEANNRSQIMRSQNQVTRLFTMFQTQPLQNFSRLFTAFNRYNTSVKTKNNKMKAEATEQLKSTLTAFVVQSASFVLVAQLFKALLGTERKDRNFEEISLTADILRDIGSTVMGMFPFARDVYNYITTGFEPSNAATDGINRILGAGESLYKGLEMLFDGKANDTKAINKAFRNVMIGLTQTFGIPLRNVERYVTGIIGRFNPEFALKYNSLFYSQQYTQLLKTELEKGNDKDALFVLEQMLKDKGISNINSQLSNEMFRLYKQDYNVIPTALNLKITHNNEQVVLTKEQYAIFENQYKIATNSANRILQSNAYKNLSDEAKAKAIKYIYNFYYNKSKSKALKFSDTSLLLPQYSGVTNYALMKAYNNTTSANTDANGNTISGSKKAKVIKNISKLNLNKYQRLMLIYSNGYKVTETNPAVETTLRKDLARYITSLSISNTEKLALAEECGYTIRNGKIVIEVPSTKSQKALKWKV